MPFMACWPAGNASGLEKILAPANLNDFLGMNAN